MSKNKRNVKKSAAHATKVVQNISIARNYYLKSRNKIELKKICLGTSGAIELKQRRPKTERKGETNKTNS